MCRTCLRYRARCAEPCISGFRRCGKRNAYTTISACGRAYCRAQQGSPAPLRGGGVSAPPTPPSTQETPLSAAHGGAAQRAVAPQLSGHRRASPASRLGLRRDTHAQRAGGAGVLPAPPRWRSRTCRTRRCPEAPRGRSPLRKTAARKHRARPAGPAGGGGWARGLLPPEQLRGMFELRLGSRKPRPQFSWTLAVSGGQGYGDHTLR